jgi:hypothetical protein
VRLVVGALLIASPAVAQTHVLVACGLGGEPRYQETFLATGLAVARALEERMGVPRPNIRLLAEDPARDTMVAARSTKEEIDRSLAAMADRAAPGATILIVLIGHGSEGPAGPRVNLPGPDLTAVEFAALLERFGTRQVVVVNAASASGDWVREVARPGRVVLTATRSTREREETQFGRHFAEALASDEADRDKDGRLSVLEAFEYARREVVRAYERDQRLRTEHPLLDADGDGVGTMEPVATEGDGAIAATLYLGGQRGGTPLAGLAAVKDSLEREVARLRGRKPAMDAGEYERRLEGLLLELARVNRELRAEEGRR